MSATQVPVGESSSSNLDKIGVRFEAVWQARKRSDIEEHSSKMDEERRVMLVEFARADLELRLKAGKAARVENYLVRFPDLAQNPDAVLDLVKVEFAERRKREPGITPEEYCERFPQCVEELRHWRADCATLRFCPEPIGTGPSPVREPEMPCRLGRYRITSILGTGGFGVVYRGYDDELRRDVAIKVPHRDRITSQEDVEEYLKEARVAASLDHPHIVPVFDVGRTEDSLCFVVSRFIEGSNLKTKITTTRFACTESAYLVAIIAEALHYAHQRGLVHRDVKPGNILIDVSDKPYLADFGLVLTEEDFGRGPGGCGTLAYMSPEQANGEAHRVDGRSDIFSLGTVLYELLTGRRPFLSRTQAEVLEQVTSIEPRPLREVDNTIPQDLERICLKAMSKRASERFATAKDMADDLWHFLAHAPEYDQFAGPSSIAFATGSTRGSDRTPIRAVTSSDQQAIKIVPKGLRSFDAHDADFFLELLPGPRDRGGLPDSIRFWKTLIEETDADDTFSAGLIYGPSGCGKSSLVKAGLLPRLSSDVIAVYVEATAGETEARLLNSLRKRCSALPAHLGLKETLAALRRGQGIPVGKKVLIVLDQFEQWLHAKREEQNTELVQALRQCDGERAQCIVMVRDDFWMAATRFMRELEVRLLEGQNSAAVDLFDLRHAKKVLVAFGRAFGALPDVPGNITKDQVSFLDQAVSGLAEEGKVISVRLALFAEMVKGKTWTPATLKAVGGIEGVGITFLEETFSTTTAPPEHRVHQEAVFSVLKTLLPEAWTDIKGHMRSYQELLEASGYANPTDFQELLHILDSEVRLVTPTDPEGVNGELETPLEVSSGQRFYQLTHDYLVPSIREWLIRKQKETRQGRAELRLAVWSSVWNGKPENRNLPSSLEWVNIRLMTRKKDWTPPQRRMMRKATRYHAVRGLAIAALFALIGWVSYEGHGKLEAHALRERLLDANTTEVPTIVKDMGSYRRWIDPLLREAFSEAAANQDARKQLHASLALMPVDPDQVDYLYCRLLDAEPQEVAVLRDALTPHKDELLDKSWEVVEKPEKGKEHQRLRAGSALAEYDPESQRWAQVQEAIANDLVGVPAVYLARWMDSLRPVREKLLVPLSAVYRDTSRRDVERSLATDILAEYAAEQPKILADLVMDADEKQFAMIFPKFKEQSERGLPRLTAEIDRRLPPDAKDDTKEKLAKRQANAAVALLKMNQPAKVWPLLKHSPDPRVRSYLIHRFGPMGADAKAIVKRMDEEPDPTIRRALILSLGEFADKDLSAEQRTALLPKLQDIYRSADDPGLHAAAEWLVRQWKQEAWLKQVNEEWAKDKEQREKRLDGAKQMLAKEKDKTPPQWYVNGQGQTMVVIPGPVEFLMGSPPTEKGHTGNEVLHLQRIGRTFAISKTPVTVEQFLRFRKSVSLLKEYAPTDDCPMHGVTWYDAAGYCNWLSEQEGISKEQWCYETNLQGHVTKLAEKYLSLTGYRLPTEAESEFSCRAGAGTSRYYGECEAMLAKYGWSIATSGDRSWPVGSLKPNDFGIFDMHGNLWCWCQSRWQPYSQGQGGKAADDDEESTSIINENPRVVRGGTFASLATYVRSAFRDKMLPSARLLYGGFRPARTISVE